MCILQQIDYKPVKNQTFQMALLVRHAMAKTLLVHKHVTFVQKRVFGCGDKWLPDVLSKEGKYEAFYRDMRIHVPCCCAKESSLLIISGGTTMV